MSLPKDPEKLKEWLSKQKPKTQKKWSDPERLKKLWAACSRPGKKGSDSPRWKGDDVGYDMVHQCVRKVKPRPPACPNCGSVYCRMELANLNGHYNRDPNNYVWLCTTCHKRMDGFAYKMMKEETRHGLFFNQYYQASIHFFLDFECV
jgi:hypothetical protein